MWYHFHFTNQHPCSMLIPPSHSTSPAPLWTLKMTSAANAALNVELPTDNKIVNDFCLFKVNHLMIIQLNLSQSSVHSAERAWLQALSGLFPCNFLFHCWSTIGLRRYWPSSLRHHFNKSTQHYLCKMFCECEVPQFYLEPTYPKSVPLSSEQTNDRNQHPKSVPLSSEFRPKPAR